MLRPRSRLDAAAAASRPVGRRLRWSLPAVVALGCVLGVASAQAGSPACSLGTTFDTDLEGWTVTGDNDFLWNGTDGNPGGCMEVLDDATGAWNRAVAPPSWAGSWAAFTPADSLIYEAIHIPSASQSGNPPLIFRIEGPGGAAEWDTGSFPANVWNRFAAPIDPAEWIMVSGEWDDLMQEVSTILVAAEMISGDEIVRIDNICLTNRPGAAVVQDCELAEFESGVPGWTGVGVGVTGLSSGGDPGGFLRVTQTDPAGRLVAPVWWAGDWSSFDGVGSVSFSFTFLGNTLEPGRELVVAMTGAGGSAEVRVSTDAWVLPNRLWLEFAWPLESGSWNITSGTWAGLLANVQELSVSCDYSGGTDTFGIDNFARGLDSCAPPAEPSLVFHEPGYSSCGSWSFRGAGALATNPADGALYAAVDASVGSGGGVYPVDGVPAGGRIAAMSTPEGLVFTADGDGFAADNNAGILYRFVGSDSTLVWASEFHSGDDDPAGLLVAPPGFDGPNVSSGDLLITDHGNSGPDEIWAASPDSAGGERLVVPDPGTADWYDLATDGTTVWACDQSDDDLLWTIFPDGTTTTMPLSQNVTNKRAFAYDAGRDELYTCSTANPPELWRIDPRSGDALRIAGGFGGFGSGNLEIDAGARILFVADSGHGRIWEICLPPADAVAADDPAVAPARLQLALRPNPVTSGTRILMDLPREGRARLDVFDAAGRRVRTLRHGRTEAGPTTVPWDGRDGGGRPVAAGVYFVRLETDDRVRTVKAVVTR